MKKIYLIIALFLVTQILKAEEKLILDSTLTYVYTSPSDSSLSVKAYYTYNDATKQKSMISYKWNSTYNYWENYEKGEYAYESNIFGNIFLG